MRDHARLVSVYALPDAFVVVTNHRTEAGGWIGGRPVTRLDSTVTDSELGASVRAALSASQVGLPMPSREEFREYVRDLATAAGVRSWAALEKTARLCTLEEGRGGVVRVIPYRYGGTRGPDKGHNERVEAAFELPGGDHATLGAAVRRGIALSSGSAVRAST